MLGLGTGCGLLTRACGQASNFLVDTPYALWQSSGTGGRHTPGSFQCGVSMDGLYIFGRIPWLAPSSGTSRASN